MSFDPNLCRNESEVESKLIVQYLLPNLGYAPDTWSQEVTIGKVRLDFLASMFGRKDGEFKTYKNVVIEAKHPKENLDRHTYKLRRYIKAADAEYGLLTNGKEIRIYQRNEVGENISLVFQCQGEEVEDHLAEIRKLIGNRHPQLGEKIHPESEQAQENLEDKQLQESPELVIPSHINLIERQHKLVGSASAQLRLKKKLAKVQDEYDFVIIDTPPSRDLYAKSALIAANYLIIPSDLKPFSNQGLKSVKKFIEEEINEIKENVGMQPLKILGVLPSKISTNAKYLKHSFPQQRDVVAQKYNLPLMENIISERTALSKCINETITMGNLEIPDPKSIFSYADKNDSASVSAGEFQALAMEILEKTEF